MYNPQVPMNAQQMGQPIPQGGNMPVTQGQMASNPAMQGAAMAVAGGGGGGGAGGMGGMGGMQGLDPAVVQAVLALQSQQGRRAGVDRQMALADQLRADGNSQLQGRRTGIANVGASVLNAYAAKKQMEGAEAKGGKLDDERMQASSKFFDLIRGLREGGGGGGGGGFGGMM